MGVGTGGKGAGCTTRISFFGAFCDASAMLAVFLPGCNSLLRLIAELPSPPLFSASAALLLGSSTMTSISAGALVTPLRATVNSNV